MPTDVHTDMRWQDQNVVKKDGQWSVDGFVCPLSRITSNRADETTGDRYPALYLSSRKPLRTYLNIIASH
jgi:hypothetical protein